MATTFFLLLPEALHIIADGLAERLEDHDDHDDHRFRLLSGDHDDHGDGPHVEEADITWRWGASVMGGFLFPVVLHAFFPSPTHDYGHDDTHDHNRSADRRVDVEKTAAVDESQMMRGVSDNRTEGSDSSDSDDDEYTTFCCVRLKNLSLFLSFNLGEMLHNFTDGIFVGAAYMGCGSVMGNSVAIATVVHEIPNQLAGYLVMVNQNGIRPCTALLLNFLFGLSVVVGALLVLSLTPSDVAVGSIFAIGGGIFLHVAISEMLGTAERNIEKPKWWLYVFLAFFVGAVLIGMVLINHEHCGEHHH